MPPECDSINTWAPDPSNIAPVNGGETPVPYVEVRTCYHFTTLFNLHLQLPFNWSLNIGDIWMQRSRFFVVGDY